MINNIYVTIEEATNYFEAIKEDKFNLSWSQKNDELKKKLIFKATTIIDSLIFIGRKYSCNQLLKWPRVINCCYLTSGNNIPVFVKNATCEVLYQLVNQTNSAVEIPNINIDSKDIGLKSYRIGDLAETFSADISQQYIGSNPLTILLGSIEAYNWLKPYILKSVKGC